MISFYFFFSRVYYRFNSRNQSFFILKNVCKLNFLSCLPVMVQTFEGVLLCYKRYSHFACDREHFLKMKTEYSTQILQNIDDCPAVTSEV